MGELHAGALGPGLTAPAIRSAAPSELGVVAGQLAVVLREDPKGQGSKGAKQHPRNAAPEDLRLDNMLAAKYVLCAPCNESSGLPYSSEAQTCCRAGTW